MKVPTLPPIPTAYLIAGGAVLAAIAYVTLRGAKQAGQDIGAGTVNLVDGVISGAVVTGAEKIGIPKTNMTECEKAKAEGRTWDASFACPAGDFLKYLWD